MSDHSELFKTRVLLFLDKVSNSLYYQVSKWRNYRKITFISILKACIPKEKLELVLNWNKNKKESNGFFGLIFKVKDLF